MKKNVRLAIVGLGYWGPNVARLCFEVDGIILKYCCDVSSQALQKIKQKYPSVTVMTDYQQIVRDPELDAVVIVTPPDTHYRIGREFLHEGKDVLIEKPMTRSWLEAKRLVALASGTGRILMVDHIFEYNSAVAKLREYIQLKKLGKIFYLFGSYTALGPVRGDVNAIYDLAPHHFYMFNFLTGKKPLWVSALGSSYLKDGNSDVAFITLGYPGGVLASVNVSWLFPFKVRNLVVVGKKKMAFFDDISPDEKLKIFDKRAFYDQRHPDYPAILKVAYREGDVIIPHLEPTEPLSQVLRHFADCSINRKKPQSDGKCGALVVRMLEGAQTSLMQHGKRILL